MPGVRPTRLLAFRHLGRESIPAVVHDFMTDETATAVSLIENVHRADMDPRDKARAFQTLVTRLGSVAAVSRETGVGEKTVRRYLDLLNLAPELQDRLAGGETRGTEALAGLARRFPDTERQVAVLGRISGFRQDVQQELVKRLDDDLENLDDLVAQATEGALGCHVVRNCTFDCPRVPDPLKRQIAAMIESFASTS